MKKNAAKSNGIISLIAYAPFGENNKVTPKLAKKERHMQKLQLQQPVPQYSTTHNVMA